MSPFSKNTNALLRFGDYHEYEDEKNEFDNVVDDNPLPNYQNKWQKYMSSKPYIPKTPLYNSKPMISKHYKKETDVKVGQNFDNKEALDLAIRLKALDECEGEVNEGYQFLNERSAPERHVAIALAVQNEFPLAYHVVCCRHLMMNISLKRDKKALFRKICKAYTTEEFSSSMSHLQDIQSDAKLPVLKLVETYRAMVQDWNYKRRKLVVYRKLPVLKLVETYRAMVQYWNYKRRKLVGLKQIKNDYDTNVMYDIAKVAGKIQLFVSHHQIDLSTMLIPNNGSLEEAFADDARKTIVYNLQRELEAEATLSNTMLGNLTRYYEQMRIRKIQITMLQNMPTMSLNSYGLYALPMTHEADIRTTNNLIRAR
uniref:Transposase, MuDR, MULE transposase domain protein n=1 Tax=Tanacetum cinerariifolium TaxID=118510 RepID=A0A6L2N0E5_TANCI|nr:transposase, MuDR, MULE transposase domain protein [Tanacetum cinerariifolium]